MSLAKTQDLLINAQVCLSVLMIMLRWTHLSQLTDVIFTDSWAGVCHRVFSVISVWLYSVFVCMACVLRLEWTDVTSLSFWRMWGRVCLSYMAFTLSVCVCVYMCTHACPFVRLPFGHFVRGLFQVDSIQRGINYHQHYSPSSLSWQVARGQMRRWQ